jgi:hypothetical protein
LRTSFFEALKVFQGRHIAAAQDIDIAVVEVVAIGPDRSSGAGLDTVLAAEFVRDTAAARHSVAVEVDPGTDTVVEVDPGTDTVVEVDPGTDTVVEVEQATEPAAVVRDRKMAVVVQGSGPVVLAIVVEEPVVVAAALVDRTVVNYPSSRFLFFLYAI